MKRVLITTVWLAVAATGAWGQTDPPDLLPENLCTPFPAIYSNLQELSPVERPVSIQFMDGYRTTLRIFREDEDLCRFSGNGIIWFAVEIRNLWNEGRVLDVFGTTQHSDVRVLRSGTDDVVYRWGYHQAWGQAPWRLFFEPLETKIFYAWWFGRDDAGLPVPPGRYDVIGSIDSGHMFADFDTPHPLKTLRHGIELTP